MRDFEMKLPDPVLAFKLLDGASSSDDECKLALPLGKNINFSLKRLFNRSIATSNIHSEAIVKQKKTLYSKSKLKNPKLLTSHNKNKSSKCNPLNKYRQISRCICLLF